MTSLPFVSADAPSSRIYAGPNPLINRGMFAQNQIKTVAVLLTEGEVNGLGLPKFYQSQRVTRISCPIQDFSVPPSTEVVHKFVEEIFEALKNGNVYLHCMGGRGRTGLMTACIAVLKNDLTASAAIIFTRTLIAGSIETPEQEKFVLQFCNDFGMHKETEREFAQKMPRGQGRHHLGFPHGGFPGAFGRGHKGMDFRNMPPFDAPASSASRTPTASHRIGEPEESETLISFDRDEFKRQETQREVRLTLPVQRTASPTPAKASTLPPPEKILPFTSFSGNHRLYAGPKPLQDPAILERLKIKTAAFLLSAQEMDSDQVSNFYATRHIDHIQCLVTNHSVPPSVKKVHEFIHLIFDALETGNVYLHCNQVAQSRTLLAVACIVILKQGKTAEEAIATARGLLPEASLDPQQQQFIQDYDREQGPNAPCCTCCVVS